MAEVEAADPADNSGSYASAVKTSLSYIACTQCGLSPVNRDIGVVSYDYDGVGVSRGETLEDVLNMSSQRAADQVTQLIDAAEVQPSTMMNPSILDK